MGKISDTIRSMRFAAPKTVSTSRFQVHSEPETQPTFLTPRATVAGGIVIAVAATFFGVTEVSAAMQASTPVEVQASQVAELPALARGTPAIGVPIDANVIIELSILLNQFVPLAQTHNIEFDAGLLDSLREQSTRVGIGLPVAAIAPGVANFHTEFGVTSLQHGATAAKLAQELTGATQAWIATLAGADAINRVTSDDDASAHMRFGVLGDNPRGTIAPASRSGVREGMPVNLAAVRELTQEFDAWFADEAHAAATSRANLRARMVAISRAHGNGRLPAEALCPIPFSPRFTMRCDVIESLVELNNAFRAHFGRDLVVRSGYRGNPGTSNHGWGLAVDFGGQMVNFGTSEFNWMVANARQFGWGHAFWAVPGGLNPQPWHWEAMDEIREMTGRWR